MNIGIFSGTFDPVHKGHIWLAQEVLERFDIDRVTFLPEPKPRGKTPKVSYGHRRAMLEIATQDDDKLDVLDISTDSHSVKSTLRFIEQQYDGVDGVKVIMGADVFDSISSWEDFDLLKERASFVVCLRNEDDGESALGVATKLGIGIEMISSDYPLISSSKTRDELAKREVPKGINQDTYEYIMKNKLYESE